MGLLSVTPCQMRRGADQVGCVGVGVLADGRPHAGAAVEHVHRLIEEQPEPAERVGPEVADEDAAVHRQDLGECASTTRRGFDQVSPSSSLVARTKNAFGLSPPATQQAHSRPFGVRSMPMVMP